MNKVARTFDSMTLIERSIAAIVLAYGAISFCLPVPPDDFTSYPWWATRISAGNIILHEAVFIVWLIVYGLRFAPKLIYGIGFTARQAGSLMVALAFWCGVVSLILSPLPGEDFGRSLRLVLFAAMFCSVIRWARVDGDSCLFLFCLGLLIGTLINLKFSFENPHIVDETMRLSGQNTPGVAMALGIHISAWLFFRSKSTKIRLFSVVVAIICGYGCGISFSRIGWIIGILGLAAWSTVSYSINKSRKGSGRKSGGGVKLFLKTIILMLGIVAVWYLPSVQEYFDWIRELVLQKDWIKSQSNDYRLAYFIGVAEIVVSNPFGVGYSGFYNAMLATEIYDSGLASYEEGFDANPHSGFLYYISAGGLVGGVICIAAFAWFQRILYLGMVSSFEGVGARLFFFMTVSFLLIGLTVPYLFNSIIMIVPIGIAAGLNATRRSP